MQSVRTLVVLVSLVLAALPAMAQELIVTGEWKPFVSAKMDGGGFTTEIIQHALLESGIDVRIELEPMPWTRCEAMVKDGKALATFPYMKTEERQQHYTFSEPIAMSRNVFFYIKERNPDFAFDTVEGLKGMRIGGAKGYFYEPIFAKAGLKVDYATDAKSGFQKLYLGRVDIVPENELVGWAIIKELYPGEEHRFAASAKALTEEPLHLMFSKAYPKADDLRGKFNAGLASIKDKGIVDKIRAKYGLTN